jgi:hypothetical protein
MKKILAILLVVLLVCAIFAGCANAEEFYQEQDRGWVMLRLPDGTIITGEIEYMVAINGVVSVTINGVKYTTHYSNVVVVRESGSQ